MQIKIISLFSLIFLAGCSGPMLRPAKLSSLPKIQDLQPSLEKSHYLLQLGDEIEVKFYYQADLNEYQAIRPDGKISLQLINDIQAAGMTAQNLAKKITRKYHKILRRPEATVIVKSIVKAKVFIGGKVATPGVMEVESTLTLLQALFQAGGFLDSAEMRQVLLIRRQNNYAKPKIFRLNLEDPQNDMLLHPFDIVYVPPSSISQVNSFVEEYISKIIPVSFGISYYLNSQ
jgi:protein involved in polysaccharide export with SLBB domain